MAALGSLIELSQTILNPQMDEQQRKAVRIIYTEGIRKQLSDLGFSLNRVYGPGADQPSFDIVEIVTFSPEHRLMERYATCMLYLLFVLLESKWDMHSMLGDAKYLTSPDFSRSREHAIAATKVFREILRLDPDLSFAQVSDELKFGD
jgi:hypothetical protein